MQQPEIAIHVSELKLLAERVLVRPIPPRECLADQGRVRRIGAVRFLKKPAANQWNIHGLEIAGAADPEVRITGLAAATKRIELFRERLHCWRRRGAVLDNESSVCSRVAHRQGVGSSDCEDAWQRIQALKQSLVKLRQTPLRRLREFPREALLRLRHRNGHGDGALGFESRIHFHQALETSA